MTACVPRRLAGWGGSVREECCVFRPERRGEVAGVLLRGGRRSYVARGLGRSYGDAAVNAGEGVISPLRLNRLLAFDAETGVVECEAGVSFADLLDVFLPRGFFPPVVPGTRFVTLGGAIAADVHGKNHASDGSFGRWVEEITLIGGDGAEVRCSRSMNPDLFRATVGGMGLTGVIVAARIRLRRVPSARMDVRHRVTTDLGAMMAAFGDGADAYPYAMAWIDALAAGRARGRGVLMQGRHAEGGGFPGPEAKRKRGVSVPFHFPGWVLNRMSVGAFNRAYLARHRMKRDGAVPLEPFFYPLDALGHWNRMYGRRGFVQYQLVVPSEGAESALAEVLERVEKSGQAPFLSVLKRLGDGGEGLLSFPCDGWTLAMDLPVKPGLRELAAELDRIVVARGGRVYLAKDALLGPQAFEAMYPRAAEFRDVKRMIDPDGRFSSSLGRRIGLVSV